MLDQMNAKYSTFEIGNVSKDSQTEMSNSDTQKLKDALSRAKTLEEVARLERMLNSGNVQ
jgi:hypothetical protein